MEKEIRVIEVKRSIFENNDRDADRLREEQKNGGFSAKPDVLPGNGYFLSHLFQLYNRCCT